METEVFVYVDTIGEPRLAGRLWARTRKGRESATFEYDPGWLERGDRFALEPALTLGPGPWRQPETRHAGAVATHRFQRADFQHR